jgi:hypothetical protein
MITLESHAATCAECWARGDKRLREEKTCDNTDYRENYNREESSCASKTNTDQSDVSSTVEENYVEAAEFPLSNCSRPATPFLYAEIYSELCPIAEDNNFDLSRVCDPVSLASMWRNCRARRQVAQKIALCEEESDTESFVSCKEYLEEQARGDDTLNGETTLGEGFLDFFDEKVLDRHTLDEKDTNPENSGETNMPTTVCWDLL